MIQSVSLVISIEIDSDASRLKEEFEFEKTNSSKMVISFHKGSYEKLDM